MSMSMSIKRARIYSQYTGAPSQVASDVVAARTRQQEVDHHVRTGPGGPGADPCGAAVEGDDREVGPRVSQLQTSHHARLLPLLDVEGDYERALHEQFASYRLRGEWSDLTPLGDPVTVIIAALAELGLPIRAGIDMGLPEGPCTASQANGTG
ncbi:GIY-YIG nuclease family protein [Streptomyces globisporus]|uniref:GIY-YIG nuclease family protein n=1 Tax=Streptomyces globisporus TaxID=1908 RepID=UPI00378D79BE